jgi:hypothetical protein
MLESLYKEKQSKANLSIRSESERVVTATGHSCDGAVDVLEDWGGIWTLVRWAISQLAVAIVSPAKNVSI